jgi:hypothetical protein
MYPYNASDAGDLNLQPNDRIAVTEYMNGEWWKGRNERTGQEGIFPKSYVRVEEKAMPPPAPSSYGNMPTDVAQGQQEEPSKGKSTAQKLGGKLGNAAIFGAGGKFVDVLNERVLMKVSYDWKQYCQLYLLKGVLIDWHAGVGLSVWWIVEKCCKHGLECNCIEEGDYHWTLLSKLYLKYLGIG